MARRRQEPDEQTYEMVISGIHRQDREDAYIPITLETTRGDVETRLYEAPGASRGVIFVGGAGGGWDTPMKGVLYPQLCERLSGERIAALRVRYRDAGSLEECTLDVLAGLALLRDESVEAAALVGHSFGGAVVIQAAAQSDMVRICLPLSTQSYGAAPAAVLGPRCSIFLFHGTDDEVLPPSCSEYVYDHSCPRQS